MDLQIHTRRIALDLVDRDPRQPRQDFNEAKIRELAESIKKTGLLQKPVVKPHPKKDGRFILVAGERRLRALRLLSRKSEEFVVLEGSAVSTFALSLVENLHREDMNPIEEALAFKRLFDEEGMTWGDISQLTGKSLATIRNRIRILTLPDEIQKMIREGKLPQVHAIQLSQFRGEKAELIRMAHKLLAGEEIPELAMQTATQHGERIARARLPDTPEGLLRRLLDYFGWRSKSAFLVFESFLKLPQEERERVVKRLPLHARQNLAKSMGQLSAIIERVLAEDIFGLRVEDRVPATQSPADDRAQGPVEVESDNRQTNEGAPTLEVSLRALETMFFPYGGRIGSNLGRTRLRNALGLGEISPDAVAEKALHLAFLKWSTRGNGNPKETELIALVKNIREGFGDLSFPEFLLRAQKENSSIDPVDLAPCFSFGAKSQGSQKPRRKGK